MQFVGRHRAQQRRRAADHVRDRRAARPHRVVPRGALRATPARTRCGSATAPLTSARTTSTARCSTRSSSTRCTASACRAGCGRSSRPRPKCATKVWRKPDQGIWEARGKPQHYVSSKLMCWVAMDRAAKLAAIRGNPRARGRRGAPRPRRSTPTSSTHGLTKDGVLRQHYDTDALDASTLLAAMFGFLPGEDERMHAIGARDRRRSDRARLRAALPHRRDRRRAVGQGGHVPDLLVLAGVGAVDRRRGPARPRPDGAPAAGRVPARAVRRGVRRRHRPAPRELPPGVLAPGADRGLLADHPRRAAGAGGTRAAELSGAAAVDPDQARRRRQWPTTT